jgi:hypothetical protein
MTALPPATTFNERVVYDLAEDQPPFDHTRDGKHVFWFRSYDRPAQISLVWDGVAGPRFDDFELLDGGPVVFSSDRCHVAWVGRRGGRFVVGVDDVAGDDLSGLDTRFLPTLSHDGRRIALLANIGGRPRVVVDGAPILQFEAAAAPPVFSLDGEHLAFVAVGDAGKQRVVVDGVAGPQFDELGGGVVGAGPQWLVFSRDGQRFAYGARSGDMWRVVIDGEIGPPYAGLYGLPTFSTDGTRVAYQAVVAKKARVVLDGTPQELHQNVGRPIFSSDGKRVMYMVSDEERFAMVVDGERGPEFDDVYIQPNTFEFGYTFSPDSRHFGYLACRGKRRFHRGKWFAVVDGEIGPEFDDVGPYLGADKATRAKAGEPRFSPDGSHFAFAAQVGKQWSMVIDGVPGPSFHLVGYPLFSESGRLAYFVKLDKKRAAFVLDGKTGPPITGIYEFDDEPCVFSPDGAHLVYEGEIDGAFHPVVDDLVGPELQVGVPIFADDRSISFFGFESETRQICRITYSP